MVLDSLENAHLYYSLHPQFKKAFEYIKNADVSALEGRVEIDGDNLFLIAIEANGEGHEGAEIEAHKLYIDIQVGLAGVNEFGWKPAAELANVSKPFDEADDYGFWSDDPYAWVPVHPNQFAIFFPEDGHTPKGGSGHLRKLVVKVKV